MKVCMETQDENVYVLCLKILKKKVHLDCKYVVLYGGHYFLQKQ